MANKFLEALQSKLRLRNVIIREFLAEFLGTFILIVFGNAAVAQAVLTNNVKGSFFAINWGYGLAVTLAVLVSGGVSGGHVNPAVTLAMAVWGKHPWSKVPVYMVPVLGRSSLVIRCLLKAFCFPLFGLLGCSLHQILTVFCFFNALDAFEPHRSLATAGIWATYPGSMTNINGTLVTDFLSNGNGFGDQVLGTMLLLICVCAITDPRNMEVPKYMVPLLVGFVVLNIGICFGFNSGYAINPARDLAPRLFTILAGWGETPFTAATSEGLAWWWVPVVAPHIGAVLGVMVYLFLVELHHPESQEFALPQVLSHESVASSRVWVSDPQSLAWVPTKPEM
nr:aquaporin-9-like [Cherax quadricarinatus]